MNPVKLLLVGIALLACHNGALAAQPLPASLTGTWSTGETPFEGGTRQIDLYLEPGGTAVMVGARRYAGKLQALPLRIGMPMRTTLDGNQLQARALPADIRPPQRPEDMTLSCKVAQASLVCHDPRGATLEMTRRSDSATADIVQMQAAIGRQLAEHPEKGAITVIVP